MARASCESSSSDNSMSDETASQRNAVMRRSLHQLHTPDRSPLASAVYAVRNEPDEQGHKVLHQIPLNLYTAMFNNGMILGLTCATVVPQKSLPAPNAPPALRPTRLQMEIIHSTWIDRLPFPKWRDAMITNEEIFNQEEFMCDVFNMSKSISIRSGGLAWEPNDWIVDKGFRRKWGWLLK